MRIAFDGVRLSKKPMGVTNIGISIINTYARLYPDYEIFILMNGDLHPEVRSRLAVRDNIKIVRSPLPIFPSVGFLWSIVQFNRLLRKIRPDVLIAPNFFVVTWLFPKRIKLVLYVHDLVYRQYRSTMQFITKTQMDLFFERSLKRSDIIWLNSAYTQETFARFYPTITEKKKLFTGAGINPGFMERVSASGPALANPFFTRQGGHADYILFVGTVEPRKNLAFLLRLFALLEKGKYQLVIAGDPGWGDMRATIDAILSESDYPAGSVHFMGYVADDELIALYRDAAFFISTSLNEGLGLPQLEAMACGCPVICPHNSAMIEVVEGAGLTVKGWETENWMNAIKEIALHKEKYIDAGYARVQQYHWETIVPALNDHLASAQSPSVAPMQLSPCN